MPFLSNSGVHLALGGDSAFAEFRRKPVVCIQATSHLPGAGILAHWTAIHY